MKPDQSQQEKNAKFLFRLKLGLSIFFSLLLAVSAAMLSGPDTQISSRPGSASCSYPGCGQKAEVGVTGLMGDLLASEVRSSPYYEIDSGTYQKTSTRDVYVKEGTLTLDSDEIRLEDSSHWEQETRPDGRGRVTTIEGKYCAAHRADGISAIEKEVRRVWLWNSGLFRFVLAATVFFWAICLIPLIRQRLRRKQRPARSEKR